MSIASVITFGYINGVNFIPTLGYGNFGGIIPPPPSIPQQTDGGARKPVLPPIHNEAPFVQHDPYEDFEAFQKRTKRFEEETKLLIKASEEREARITARKIAAEQRFSPQPVKKKKGEIFLPALQRQKIGDVIELRTELEKLKFSVQDGIILQRYQEDEENQLLTLLLIAS